MNEIVCVWNFILEIDSKLVLQSLKFSIKLKKITNIWNFHLKAKIIDNIIKKR